MEDTGCREQGKTFRFRSLPPASRILHPMLVPSMRIAHRNHGRENIVPGSRLHECFIREHATVPADVLEPLCRLVVLTKPETGIPYHIELAIRRVREAMAARLVMRTRAEHFAVVLCYVE